MKWPRSLTLIRHGQSEYNDLRKQKEQDPTYIEFKKCFEKWPNAALTRKLAREIKDKYSLGVGDYDTPLTTEGILQSRKTGIKLRKLVPPIPTPDVILYSPYVRARDTLSEIHKAWPSLIGVKSIKEDRIREQEHGLSLIYNDWRVFQAFHPEQKELRELLGPYWYQYPQGESASQVRDRVRSVLATLIREYSNQHVMMITHHLTILSIRATLERLTPEQFIELDTKEKPVNCGVTHYRGVPKAGKNGKLVLCFYNKKFY